METVENAGPFRIGRSVYRNRRVSETVEKGRRFQSTVSLAVPQKALPAYL